MSNIKSNAVEYTVHPAADLFPMFSETEHKKLVESMKAHGQLETIKVIGSEIVDGRNRLKACIEANLVPAYEAIEVDDVIGYVAGVNLVRRHLTTKQRAAIAADLANLTHGNTVNQLISERPFGPSQISVKKAAEVMGVSPMSVKRAKKTKKENPAQHAKDVAGVKDVKAKIIKQVKVKKTSWPNIALEEGVLPKINGGNASAQIKGQLAAINDDPEIFINPAKEQKLRKACQTLHAIQNNGATVEEVKLVRDALSLTSQQKFDVAIRVATRQIEYEIELRVAERLDTILPSYRKDSEEYQAISDAYCGVFTNKEYKKLLSVLHPDRVPEKLQVKFKEMFKLIKEKEALLCKAKPRTASTTGIKMPNTAAELMAIRAAKQNVRV